MLLSAALFENNNLNNKMNREIKFRAWDGSKMHNKVSALYPLFYRDGKYPCRVDDTVTDQHISPVVIMQYIGLKDKNGVEIYEGDILCNDEYQTWEWRGVVKFSHGVFGAEWLSNVKSQSMVGSWGQKHNLRKLDDDIIERQIVIGNIYENPELLTEPS